MKKDNSIFEDFQTERDNMPELWLYLKTECGNMSFSDEPSTVSFGGYSQRNPAMDQQMREAIQVSISSTIYAQLIHAQIPKAKKRQSSQ